jgi:hypothetical protein
MNDLDLPSLLVNYGVPKDAAVHLQQNIDGRDLVTLTNALNGPSIGDNFWAVSKILSKYGIAIQEAHMTQSPDHLSAMLRSARNTGNAHTQVEAAIVEWLQPISESNDPLAHMLALEGYNYVTNVQDTHLGEKLIDWLDENQVDYLTNGSGEFQIKCPDREGAYRVSGAITRIMHARPVVRDSVEEETVVSEKNNKGASRSAPQNVAKFAAQQRGKSGAAGAHNSKDPARKDPHDRKAKHKGRTDECDFGIGETVMVGEHEATVKIPNGPGGTVGVVMDGQLSMVSAGDVSRLDERVLGITTVPSPLLRLRELAGLAPAPAVPPSMPSSTPPAPMGDITMGSDIDDLGGDVDPAPTDLDDLGSEPPMGAPEMGGVPGDIGSDPVEAPGGPTLAQGVMAPMQSEAFSQIEDHLNGVQSMLGDVKLSEYKSLVKKLEDLAGQVRLMGRDYLGERRMKP